MTQKENPPRARRWAQSRQNNASAVSVDNYNKIWVGNRIVGDVEEEEFIKKVNGSVHFLHRPPAIAFDILSLEKAKDAGATSVRVIDVETDKSYRAPISTIFSKGFRFNRGYGEQVGLEFQHWQSGDGPLVKQLELWG